MTINRFERLNLDVSKNQNTPTFFEVWIIKFKQHILAVKTHDLL